jgi:hypothetical protein
MPYRKSTSSRVGDLARRLSRRARHVDGVDLDQATIKNAQHLTDPASGIDFACGDVLELIVWGVYRERTLTDRLLSTAAVPANSLAAGRMPALVR